MGKKKQKVLYDADGARRVMRKRDYMADMGGQLAIGVMANLVGQLTYFYTDKVGMAVGGVGIAMMIAKIIDCLLYTSRWKETSSRSSAEKKRRASRSRFVSGVKLKTA